jgi:hypothetical protein
MIGGLVMNWWSIPLLILGIILIIFGNPDDESADIFIPITIVLIFIAGRISVQ